MELSDITVVICNWMQTRFTLGAVKNIRHWYPQMSVVVVDDGSDEEKKKEFDIAYARDSYSKNERYDNQHLTGNFNIVRTEKHIGHGSALDYGVAFADTPFVLTMDNDIRVVQGGLVEEYMGKMTDEMYAVGTTYYEPELAAKWIDPWFSLYRVAPIKELHLTFSNFLFPVPGKTFHVGTGAFLHTMLTYDTLHRPQIWKAVHYPEPELIPQLWHLKKFPDDKEGDKRYDMWHQWIDGGV